MKYISLDASKIGVPQLMFTRGARGNRIKKNDLAIYLEAEDVLEYAQKYVADLQRELDARVVNMLMEKDNQINERAELHFQNIVTSWSKKKDELILQAREVFNNLLLKYENELSSIKQELTMAVLSQVKIKLGELAQCEVLVSHLSDFLHSKIDGETKKINVEMHNDGQGCIINVENDDVIISVDTNSIINELQLCLSELDIKGLLHSSCEASK